MLRIHQSASSAVAKSYYSTADYYTEGQELVGRWRGRGAAMLGLAGTIDSRAWDALCDNRNPDTGRTLTARQKADRTVGYDFNFHVPKSVSLLYGMTRDDRLLDAFRDAVGETMTDIEAEMQTRVRSNGRQEDRTTGNMAWGEFVHFTARPVDGVPDPHLHAHCFVFNSTWDSQESRWKAGQFRNLKRDAPYFEAVFHSRLASKMIDLGIPVERTRTGWELADIALTAIPKFSRRKAQIERHAAKLGITDPEALGELGAKTREAKAAHIPLPELQERWSSRLSPEERQALLLTKHKLEVGPTEGGFSDSPPAAREAVRYALDHWLERQSVVPERRVLATAMKHAVGMASRQSVERELAASDIITADRDGRRVLTTRAVLAEERRVVDFARGGRGTCRRLGSADHAFQDTRLNAGQRRAVLHVLTSPDRVILVRGAAGVGKTTMMQEAAAAIEAGGKRVFAFAPSSDASRGVLREAGFNDADTVTQLQVNPKLQEQARGQVLWIDEASLLGTRTAREVFDLADRIDARVVLSGDRRQHKSVERGDTLRLLEQEAGLASAEIKEIQRQAGDYKHAVLALSEGRIRDGFAELDRLNWIREAPAAERELLLVADYLDAVEHGKTALVVSPTHAEGDRVTAGIRRELERTGKLGPEEHQLQTLESLKFTLAEKSDALNYTAGDVVVFHQNAPGYRKGQRLVVGQDEIPFKQAKRFEVFHAATLPVRAGDILRITRNGTTTDRAHRLNNGNLVTVKGFTPGGDLQLDNGWLLSKEYGHVDHGYVVTSHASQGKSVQRVFIAQSADSFPASSPEQFYVSVSRGKERATIYSDNKHELLEAVSHAEDRTMAFDLFASPDRHRHAAVARSEAVRLPQELHHQTVRQREPDRELVHD